MTRPVPNKGVATPGTYPNENNSLTLGGEVKGDEAGSRAGDMIAYTLTGPADPNESRVPKQSGGE